jgi:hypothetical protein
MSLQPRRLPSVSAQPAQCSSCGDSCCFCHKGPASSQPNPTPPPAHLLVADWLVHWLCVGSHPGESFKLSVTFTPDFYLSRLSEPLLLITSTGITQFPLEVTLPHHLLAACHERSPRSQWEQQCHSVTVAILSVGLVALLLLTLRVRPSILQPLVHDSRSESV